MKAIRLLLSAFPMLYVDVFESRGQSPRIASENVYKMKFEINVEDSQICGKIELGKLRVEQILSKLFKAP